MANARVKVKALRAFAHGNINAQPGRTYEMVRADAVELEKAGFLEMGGTGDADAQQVIMPMAKPAPGDVVADDAADILGSKMDDAVENKMAKPAANKAGK